MRSRRSWRQSMAELIPAEVHAAALDAAVTALTRARELRLADGDVLIFCGVSTADIRPIYDWMRAKHPNVQIIAFRDPNPGPIHIAESALYAARANETDRIADILRRMDPNLHAPDVAESLQNRAGRYRAKIRQLADEVDVARTGDGP